ncbi:MAG: WG repeat-containing protein [Bacteroidales bacterium]|nr:WG repeat-containing protein [Bacteroidales bacterium]
MAKLVITVNKSVKELKEEYKKSFGTELRVYNGRSEADETSTLSELGVTNEGTVECRGSLTVGSFVSKLYREYGLKVKVFTPDNWVSVLAGISLAKAAGLKKQISHCEMESYISYKKRDYVDDRGKKSVIVGDYVLEVKQSGHVDVVRIPRNAKGTMTVIAKDLGFKVEEKWNTQDLGRHLIKEFGDGATAVFGDITINKLKNGKIEIVEIPHNTKEALRDISQQIGFKYDPSWITQTFGKKLLDYLIDNKEKAEKILKAPNLKKETKSAEPVASVEACDTNNLEVFRENGKYGFKDENGKVVISCQYDYALSDKNGFYKVKIADKWGYIDSTGKVIVPIEYDKVIYVSDGNYIIANQGDWRNPKIGVLSSEGKVILPFEYDDYNDRWLEDKYVLRKAGGICILGNGGVIEKELPYDYYEQFNDTTGLSLVRRDGKWGYVNKELDEVIPCENQYYVLCVMCNPYFSESMPMDADTLKDNLEFLKSEYEEDLVVYEESEEEECGLSEAEELSKANIGYALAIWRRNLFEQYASEYHSYIDDVEEIALTPIAGEDWWDEYRCAEHDDDETFFPDEADIEYSDYPVQKDCITTVYKRATSACGLFYRLIIKDVDEFEPSKLKVRNPGEGSDNWYAPDVFYDDIPQQYLGDGFGDNEFEYSTARLFWDGEEIDLPEEKGSGYDYEDDENW